MAASPSRHLSGQYKDFFAVEAHPTVEHWYIHQASPDLRSKMKQVVSKIIAFDLEKAKATLRTTYDPCIIKANAVFEKNNGPSLISKKPLIGGSSSTTSYQQQTVQWLAFASVAELNMFRETIGLMIPPSRFSSHRHVEEFDPKRKYWKNESQITDTKSLVCGELLHKPSEMYEIPCETLAKHRTVTGTQYSWKLPVTKAAQEEKIGGAFSTVSLRAHDATFRNAPPWGVYGTPGDVNANKTQWVSQTKEDFADTFFVQDRNTRRFQNFNDNYIGLLSKHYTDKVKEDRAAAKGETFTSSYTASVKKRQQQEREGYGSGGGGGDMATVDANGNPIYTTGAVAERNSRYGKTPFAVSVGNPLSPSAAAEAAACAASAYAANHPNRTSSATIGGGGRRSVTYGENSNNSNTMRSAPESREAPLPSILKR